MIHLLVSIVLIVFLARFVLRLVLRPFGFGRRYHRHRGWGIPFGDGYSNPYAYGYRRRGFGGSVLPIIALVALDRLFGRRW